MHKMRAESTTNLKMKVRYVTKKRLVRVVIFFVTILTLTEILLRYIYGLGNPPLLQPDQEIGYLFQANQDLYRFGHRVKINEYHQRSEKLPAIPGADALRILCLGDSVTWGGVQTDQTDTYPEQLGTILRSRNNRKIIEIMNASAGSWGIENETEYLKRFGTFGSHIVIFQIGSHDLVQRKSTGERVGLDPQMPSKRPWSAIWELATRYGGIHTANASAQPEREVRPLDDEFDHNIVILQGSIRKVIESGAKYIIILTPERGEIKSSEGIYTKFRTRFLDECRRNHYRFIDLAPHWRHQPSSDSYFRDEIHLNQQGNRAIAEALEIEIGELGL